VGDRGHVPPLLAVGDRIYYVPPLFGKKSRISIFICDLRSFLLDLSQVIRLILLSKYLLAITYVSLCSIFEDRRVTGPLYMSIIWLAVTQETPERRHVLLNSRSLFYSGFRQKYTFKRDP